MHKARGRSFPSAFAGEAISQKNRVATWSINEARRAVIIGHGLGVKHTQTYP